MGSSRSVDDFSVDTPLLNSLEFGNVSLEIQIASYTIFDPLLRIG